MLFGVLFWSCLYVFVVVRPPRTEGLVHEFGIASEIWQAVRRSAERHGGGRVLSITMELGEVNLIEDEQLRFWVTALAERDGSPGVELRISHIPAQARCRQCGEARAPFAKATGPRAVEEAKRRRGEPPSPRLRGPGEAGGESRFPGGWYARPEGPCPKCGATEVEVVGGREIRVVSAEIESSPLSCGHPLSKGGEGDES